MSDLQETVAASADTADLHAPVPALLLELQALLGTLSATVTAGTGRGRRPFRPEPPWADLLGELAYGVYLVADQSGVDLRDAVEQTARGHVRRAEQAQPDSAWPFGAASS